MDEEKTYNKEKILDENESMDEEKTYNKEKILDEKNNDNQT